MLKKSLEVDEKLGRLEGMAIQYANLGTVYELRGDIEKAREYWEKAVGLHKKVGMKPEIEKVQRWIEELKDK
jgi:tetratricopeptide (TPR) repeat protein